MRESHIPIRYVREKTRTNFPILLLPSFVIRSTRWDTRSSCVVAMNRRNTSGNEING